MQSKPLIHVVGTTCRPEMEEKLNAWYDQIHIPMLLKFPLLRAVTRYGITKASDEYPKYLAVYEFESRQAFEAYERSPELAAALAEMRESWKEGDLKIVWRVQYEMMRTWHK